MSRPEIVAAVQKFLDRFTPPKTMAGNDSLMLDEAQEIVAAVTRYAPPPAVFDGWWGEVGSELVRRMKTRAWPLVSEVETACRAVNERRNNGSTIAESAIEQSAIDSMAIWFGKFGSQMPGYGRASRTKALIDRGVLADIREARWRGFTLTPDQARDALNMPMGHAEAEHDARVMADIRAIGARMSAHRAKMAELRKSVKPSADF